MDTRDKQIALLNINTAAAQLAVAAGGDTLTLAERYDAFFEHLQEKVFAAIQGSPLPFATSPATTPLQQVEAMGTYVSPNQTTPQPPSTDYGQRPAPQTGGVQVIGKQHGELPAWLADAVASAGISKVYDNRIDRDGNSVQGTKRPWFKEAAKNGEGSGPGGEPLAFWPPKAGGR